MTLSEQLLEIFTNSQNVETLEKKVIDRKFFWNFAFWAKRKRIAKEVLEQFISSLLSREKNLTPQDKKQTMKVAELLGIDSETFNLLYQDTTIERYLHTFLEWEITEARFEILSDRLEGFDNEKVLEKKHQYFQQYLTEKYQEHIIKWYLIPSESEELQKIAKIIHAKIKFDEMTQLLIDKILIMWKLIVWANVPIEVDVNLKKWEECYYENTYLDFLGYSRKRVKAQYWWSTVGVDFWGVSYGTSSGDIEWLDDESLTKKDDWEFYITNQRIIFIGERESIDIKYDDILSVNTQEWKLIISKANTNPLIFDFILEREAILISMGIEKLMEEKR